MEKHAIFSSKGTRVSITSLKDGTDIVNVQQHNHQVNRKMPHRIQGNIKADFIVFDGPCQLILKL